MAAITDLVLVHIDYKPAFYARIEDISPDIRPGWWQVKLLALSFPLQLFTWILDTSQIEGAPYTMGGTPVRLEKVVPPAQPEESQEDVAPSVDAPGNTGRKAPSKVVSLAGRKKDA